MRRDRPRPGTFHDIYPQMDSFAEDEGPLPVGIIDPDAAFAVWWNQPRAGLSCHTVIGCPSLGVYKVLLLSLAVLPS